MSSPQTNLALVYENELPESGTGMPHGNVFALSSYISDKRESTENSKTAN
jgi:hypothetical protein